ncbi:hypothetical protein VFPPC_16082 [Pochonia chlamydosporia 170]|uniref:Uncharacterized protein n=1 Tax=Pochonia chlamydosporia 170 TaxID=1380566 RepID=A0A179FMV7_METCM|nr:hypothetical protein VFPPC_16082 [Pochonia chlamydosporia 170]OAQ66936.1 hypothetical protein VFPPC_16082 [Pochonia chlamydosporia 170]
MIDNIAYFFISPVNALGKHQVCGQVLFQTIRRSLIPPMQVPGRGKSGLGLAGHQQTESSPAVGTLLASSRVQHANVACRVLAAPKRKAPDPSAGSPPDHTRQSSSLPFDAEIPDWTLPSSPQACVGHHSRLHLSFSTAYQPVAVFSPNITSPLLQVRKHINSLRLTNLACFHCKHPKPSSSSDVDEADTIHATDATSPVILFNLGKVGLCQPNTYHPSSGLIHNASSFRDDSSRLLSSRFAHSAALSASTRVHTLVAELNK